MWESGNYREDDALNIAAFKLTTGERKTEEEIERIFEDPADSNDELYEEYCENFELVVKVKDELKLMGSLPYFHPRVELSKDDHGEGKSSRRREYGLALLGILAAAITLGIYIPMEKKNQRISQLKSLGLTEEQAHSFDSIFSRYADDSFFNSNYNQTALDFARYYGLNPVQAQKAFDVYKSFMKANEFLSFTNTNGYDGLRFLQECPEFAEDYQIVLPIYSINSTFPRIVYNCFLLDPQITMDRKALALDALKFYLNLGLVNKKLHLPTIHGLNNLTIAEKQLGLPGFDRDTYWIFTNSTQRPEGKYLLDFSPIVFKSVNSSDVYLIPKPARETWITVELLKMIKESGFDIENHPEMFLGLNGKIITNAWCIFDNPYGISYYEKMLNNRTISLTDQDVLDLMMLQWNLYSQFAPQLNGSHFLYNRDFPWYNSTELIALYPDINELRCALFKLFYLPSETFSIKDGVRKYGIEGATKSLTDALDEYKTIAGLYPNGTVIGHYDKQPHDVRFYYEDWLLDRSHNGLSNTVAQYRTFDQFLTEHWKYWDLVKFIVGYERQNRKTGGEWEGIQFVIPGVLRMFGFPNSLVLINPEPLGSGGREWSVSLPLYIIKSMREQFPNTNILFGPGYTFGLYSCGDGLIKERGIDVYHQPITDGIKEVYDFILYEPVYLMKK
ncbi:MAG: hypothetical protein QXQ04_09310 [Candidatus Bathyarchaeia archaeon]